MLVQSLGQEDPLEKEMATHFSILVRKIPCTEEPSRLQSMGPQRVRHDLMTKPPPPKFLQGLQINTCNIKIISIQNTDI